MAKTKRGSILWKTPARARGTCPVCFSTRIKLLYTKTSSDGKQVTVCKRCNAAPAARIDKASPHAQSVPFRRKHRKVFYQRISQPN